MQRTLEGTEAVRLVAVLPAPPDDVARLRRALDLSCTLLCDPDWEAHRALGLGRGGFRSVWLARRAVTGYLRLVAGGRRPRWPRQDIYRLGGTAVLDRSGRIAWLHAARDASDYAPPGEIVAAVASLDG